MWGNFFIIFLPTGEKIDFFGRIFTYVKKDFQDHFKEHTFIKDTYELWHNPDSIKFIDKMDLKEIRHFIKTTKRAKIKSSILLSRCGLSAVKKSKILKKLVNAGYNPTSPDMINDEKNRIEIVNYIALIR